jgi:predicted AAA+ superfamily ATPase
LVVYTSINSYYKIIKKDMPVGKDTLMEFLSYLEDINLILMPASEVSVKALTTRD